MFYELMIYFQNEKFSYIYERTFDTSEVSTLGEVACNEV